MYDLARTIDGFGMSHLYTETDIEAFAEELFKQAKSDKQKQTALNNLIAPVADHYLERLKKAREESDSQLVDATQIIPYGKDGLAL